MNSLSEECYHERVKQFNQGQHTMAMSKKTTMEVELHQDTVEMLEYAKETYGFRSTSRPFGSFWTTWWLMQTGRRYL